MHNLIDNLKVPLVIVEDLPFPTIHRNFAAQNSGACDGKVFPHAPLTKDR